MQRKTKNKHREKTSIRFSRRFRFVSTSLTIQFCRFAAICSVGLASISGSKRGRISRRVLSVKIAFHVTNWFRFMEEIRRNTIRGSSRKIFSFRRNILFPSRKTTPPRPSGTRQEPRRNRVKSRKKIIETLSELCWKFFGARNGTNFYFALDEETFQFVVFLPVFSSTITDECFLWKYLIMIFSFVPSFKLRLTRQICYIHISISHTDW